MTAFNKVLLMGNLTRDPQLSYTPNQTAVADFGMATNRKWTGQDGQQKEEVCFVDCRAFGRTAENINKYLHKGDPLFVEGRLSLDQWTAQDGSKKSRLRVTIESFQFISGGGKQRDREPGDDGPPSNGPQGNGPANGRQGRPPLSDSDIPF